MSALPSFPPLTIGCTLINISSQTLAKVNEPHTSMPVRTKFTPLHTNTSSTKRAQISVLTSSSPRAMHDDSNRPRSEHFLPLPHRAFFPHFRRYSRGARWKLCHPEVSRTSVLAFVWGGKPRCQRNFPEFRVSWAIDSSKGERLRSHGRQVSCIPSSGTTFPGLTEEDKPRAPTLGLVSAHCVPPRPSGFFGSVFSETRCVGSCSSRGWLPDALLGRLLIIAAVKSENDRLRVLVALVVMVLLARASVPDNLRAANGSSNFVMTAKMQEAM